MNTRGIVTAGEAFKVSVQGDEVYLHITLRNDLMADVGLTPDVARWLADELTLAAHRAEVTLPVVGQEPAV